MGKFKRKKNKRRIETGPSLTELAEIEKFGERRFKYFNRCAWCQMPKEKLLYNEKTLNQVSELAQILDRKNFKAIENRALQKRPNLAFIVLLHGPSGTGKTALVRDLCRRTKRNMLEVRSDLLRNSNVGDDEKVLVEMFEDYAEAVFAFEEFPIMFFDECEAILCKRMPLDNHNPALINGINNTVNLWLKQFQNFHGILFLATNRKDDIDEAFARRILFEVEVDHPTKETQAEIWSNLFPGVLNKAQCKQLAEETDFSGGQIKQVQTKADIHELLHGKLTFEIIRNICETNGKPTQKKEIRKIGFSR